MNQSFGRWIVVGGLVVGAAMASAQSIGVQVNGEHVNFRNQPPIYQGGRVLVPLRGVFEKMGATVEWQPARRIVVAQRGATNVVLVIGQQAATIDGQTWTMDVPAQIINGSTMVPIRFVSEALGAQVGWNSAMQLVTITANPGDLGGGGRPPIRPPVVRPPVVRPPGGRPPVRPSVAQEYLIPRGTVLPVELLSRVSSQTARKGDRIRGEIVDFRTGGIDWDRGRFDFPRGTVIEGQVTYVVRHRPGQPGMLELTFTRIVLPDGQATPIFASLTALDDRRVIRNNDGLFFARDGQRDNRMIYAGYGDEAGLVLGLASDRPLEGGGLGAIMGLVSGSVDPAQRRRVGDVVLRPGTRLGVRLNRDLRIRVPYWR